MATVFTKLPLYLSTVALLILSISTHSTLSQRRIDPELQRQIDEFITNVYLPSAQISGMGLSIVQDDGQLLYSTGYGLANIERNIPNGNSTQFCLASVSKSMTSVMVVKILHEKFPQLGEAVLDTPIRELIPEVNFTLIDRFRSEQTTFRDLLAHRTCLFDQPIQAEPFETQGEMLYRLRYNDPLCYMRQPQGLYSNQLIALAGELAGLIANKPYEDAMQDLWNELGMTETAFLQRTDNFTEMTNRAMAYYVMDNEARMFSPELLKRVKVVNAAAGVFATPSDMLKYLRLHSNLGSIDGRQIVPEHVMKWIYKLSSLINGFTYRASDEDKVLNQFGYGLTLVLGSYNGWEYINHGGYYPPYHNLFSLFPSKKLAIYSGTHMSLTRPSGVHPYILHFFIFELLNGHSYSNAKEKALKLMEKMKVEQTEKVRKDEDEWQNEFREMVKVARLQTEPVNITVGKYGSGSAGDFEILERFNEATNQIQYFMDYGKWYKGWLERVLGENALFKAHWITEVVQEDELVGEPEGRHFVAVEEGDTLRLLGTMGHVGRFKLGVGLETLPVIPWDPTSCEV